MSFFPHSNASDSARACTQAKTKVKKENESAARFRIESNSSLNISRLVINGELLQKFNDSSELLESCRKTREDCFDGVLK